MKLLGNIWRLLAYHGTGAARLDLEAMALSVHCRRLGLDYEPTLLLHAHCFRWED